MQNPPPISTYTGGSQPLLSAPSYSYPAPQVAQPVSQNNGTAITALIFGIFVLIGTPAFLGVIASIISSFYTDRAAYVSDISSTIGIFVTMYIIGGIFSLCSIAFGLAGMAEGKLKGGRGLAGSAFGIASGCFYFLSTFIILLLGIYLIHYS